MSENPWKVVAASVRGTAHERTGRPLEDAFDYRLTNGGVLIVAVADGAGSAKNAASGSNLASRAAVEISDQVVNEFDIETISHETWGAISTDILCELRERLTMCASEFGLSFESLSTTLILGLIGQTRTLLLQVGDGVFVSQSADGEFRSLTDSDDSGYINETVFLTSPDVLLKAQVTISILRVQSVAVMTDGIQLLAVKYPTNEPHSDFFRSLFTFARSDSGDDLRLAEFLNSKRVNERTDDDKTLFIATR